MRLRPFILAILLFTASWTGCVDFGTMPQHETGMQGQVLLISKPGPIPIGWVPPPLEQVTSIQVFDAMRKLVQETMTSVQGRFSIFLPPGTYYLRVKESPIPAETGPYEVTSGKMLTVEAHFDNGMR